MFRFIAFFVISSVFAQAYAGPTRAQLDSGKTLLESPTNPRNNPYRAEGELFAVFALKNKGGRFVVGPHSYFLNTGRHFCLVGGRTSHVALKTFLPGTVYDGVCGQGYFAVFKFGGYGAYQNNTNHHWCAFTSPERMKALTEYKTDDFWMKVPTAPYQLPWAAYDGACGGY